MDKDVEIGVLGAAIGLAGLLLVFVGYLLSAAAQIQEQTPRRRLKAAACTALIPFLCCLGCAWMSIEAIQGDVFSAEHLLLSAKIVLVITGIYAILATIFEVQ